MRRDRASQFLERGLVELALARHHLDFPFQQVAGMSDDLPVGRWWVMTRHWAIGEGSVEMMRFIISRDMLRD